MRRGNVEAAARYETPRIERQQALAAVAASLLKQISGFTVPEEDDDQ